MCKLSQWWRQWCSPSTFCFLSFSWEEGGMEEEGLKRTRLWRAGYSFSYWVAADWSLCHHLEVCVVSESLVTLRLPCFVRRRASPASRLIPIWVSWLDSHNRRPLPSTCPINTGAPLLVMQREECREGREGVWPLPLYTFLFFRPPYLISSDYTAGSKRLLSEQHLF